MLEVFKWKKKNLEHLLASKMKSLQSFCTYDIETFKIPVSWDWRFTGPSLCSSVCVLSQFSHVRLFVTVWTVAHQAPLSMGFSKQEYWNGLPCLPLGNLSDPGIKPVSLVSPASASGFFTNSATWEAPFSAFGFLFLFSVLSS